MHIYRPSARPFLVAFLFVCATILPAFAPGFGLTPANDDCANAVPIAISGAGFDYGVFTSAVSDLTMATGQAGEYFAFSDHSKSVWYAFTLPTHRNFALELIAAPGSTIADVSLTLYRPVGCVPAGSSLISTQEGKDGGITQNNTCGFGYGTYLIQVSAAANVNASGFVRLTLACPTGSDSKYDCPADAYVFNSGNPITQSQITSSADSIGCQSLDTATEGDCLPLANKADYLQSTWYVFTTGNVIDLLSIRFTVSPSGEKVGYRIFQGDVRPGGPSGLTQIACGLAKEDFSARFIEFPCQLQPNTTYSIALFFHKNFTNNGNKLSLTIRQRGVPPTGWPKPVLPPVVAANQLGTLAGGGANGTMTPWLDRFDCSAFISKNTCPPANPAAGTVVVGTKTYDLATWATFTLASDANVEFRFWNLNNINAVHTRIFSKTLTGNCPAPDPASTELYHEFSGYNSQVVCMPAGDYSVQVLSSSVYPLPTTSGYWDAWTYSNLGTAFELRFTVLTLPTDGKFRLDKPGEFDAINGLIALQNNILYPSTPAVFICANTVLPDSSKCLNMTKAMYREVNIGDANGDGVDDEGLLCMSGLRTDYWADPPHVYSFFKGDANQLATAAGTHAPGQKIPGLSDYAGFCIDKDDNTFNPNGIDNFCACVTPGIYTLVSLGDADNIARGDAPGFKFNILKTVHDSRANAETIPLGTTGTFTSGPDVFSCTDNLGVMPPCGNRKKLVFREFFLPNTAVVTISEIGNTTSQLSLFSGRASDLSANLILVAGCANGIPLSSVVNECAPLPAGWFTVVSYGEGPNYTDRKVWNPVGGLTGNMGDARDVGKTTRISINIKDPSNPKFNLPNKAHLAGITDWATPPPANPNATTERIYAFPTDTFCAPDVPFIPNGIASCAPGYNRVSFYVFEITKISFVQIRNVDSSFYVEVFPFDVKAQPGALLTVPPVYQCLSTTKDYRQICDLPPGKYTIAIFANDTHLGQTVTPSIYVEAVALSRFDHVWNAYNFDLIPGTNAFVNGRTGDSHPFLTGQDPSRDVFYCTTGATAADPTETRCNVQLNPLIYAQPTGVPKPLFLPGNPPAPLAQPWRNLWYTFMLTGTGTCTIRANSLTTGKVRPFVAVYESPANANIPWATLQAALGNPGDTIIAGLKLVGHNVYSSCDASGDLVFIKNGCLRDSVRYYVVVGFDADDSPNFPNQAISISIRYKPEPTFAALYDERSTANVVNGLVETAPPYTPEALSPGSTFVGPGFSLLCYTKNASDPAGCGSSYSGASAWFKFEVAARGQFYAALEALGTPNSWLTSTSAFSVWYEPTPGGTLIQLPLNDVNIPGDHRWQEGCIAPGTYYLLVRYCTTLIDLVQPYRVVLRLTDSPGDFCSNAVALHVPNFSPASANVTPDCHTIGTDFGETSTAGMGCLFGPTGKKTSWFRATVTAGPKMDIKFQLAENLTGASLNDLPYRIFFGSCGALTPIVCSAVGSNIITQNCLAPGDYYVQVAMPDKVGNTAVEGTLTLTVTATPSADPNCSPTDQTIPKADFSYTADCQTVAFVNLSTAGTDIDYLWQFPDGSTSAASMPNWNPPPGTASYPVTLTVTNTALNKSASVTKPVTVTNPFAAHVPMPDAVICNGADSVMLLATLPGAAYLWDNGDTSQTRVTSVAGTFWVKITKDGCVKYDTASVAAVNATRTIAPTLCSGESITISGQVFDKDNPGGTVTLPNAHPSGCDSVLTVNLSFYLPVASQFTKTICVGEGFFFGNQDRTQTGMYTDTLASSKGCDSIVTLLLTVTPRQTLVHAASGCTGAALDLVPTVSGASYTWSGGATTDRISVNAPGTYAVCISDTAGCVIGEETFSVTFGLLAPPMVSSPTPLCTGADVILTATGSSGDYRWFDSAAGGSLLGTGPTLLLSNVQNSTTVFVEAFQAGIAGCVSHRETVQITVLPPVFQSASASICFGQTYTLPDGTTAGASGTFTGTFTDAAGCPGTWEIELTVVTVQFVALDTVVCAGKPFTLPWGEVVTPGSNATYSHNWQHTVGGCDSLNLTVQVLLEQPMVQVDYSDFNGFGVACFGSANGSVNAVVSNAKPPYQYLWNTGGTTTTVSNAPAGTYTVTATSANGCTVVGSQTLTQPPDIALTAVKTDPTCFGSDNGAITAAVSGGTPGFDFSLNGAVYQQNPVFDNLPAGSFTLTVRDANGCTRSAPMTLSAPPDITLMAAKTDPTCFGLTNGKINLTSTGGSGNHQYSTNAVVYQQNPVFDNLSAGSYTVTVRDANGCSKALPVHLSEPADIALTAAKTAPTCFGDTDGTITASVSGGVGVLTFSLNNGPFLADPVFGNLLAGSFQLIATDGNGCRDSVLVVLVDPPKIDVSVVPTDPTCFGFADGNITATVSGGTPAFEFSLNGGAFQQNPVFGNCSAGSFHLVARDSNGCRDTVQALLVGPSEIVLDLTAQSPLCPEEKPRGSISAMASGGQAPLLFALGNGAFSGISDFNNLSPGLYKVAVQDAEGCETTAEIEIDPPASLSLFLPALLTMQWGDSILLLPQIGFQPDSLAWSPAEGLSCTSCLNPWAKPARTTVYQLMIWSPEGCLVPAQVRVEVKREVRIYVPNVFRPDNDGLNDVFTVYGGPELRSVRSLVVYDRWGEAIWQAADFPADGSVGWDGRWRGKAMPPGVYVWVCAIELADGTREVLAGDVTVLR